MFAIKDDMNKLQSGQIVNIFCQKPPTIVPNHSRHPLVPVWLAFLTELISILFYASVMLTEGVNQAVTHLEVWWIHELYIHSKNTSLMETKVLYIIKIKTSAAHCKEKFSTKIILKDNPISHLLTRGMGCVWLISVLLLWHMSDWVKTWLWLSCHNET